MKSLGKYKYDSSNYRELFYNKMLDIPLYKLYGEDLKILFDDSDEHNNYTPREKALERKTSAIPFFYIDFLVEKNPQMVIDLGCGMNFFKTTLGAMYNILVHGIDPESEQADEIDKFDASFVKRHFQEYESVIAVNSLHSYSLARLTDVILDFKSILKLGGRGFLTFNVYRLLNRTSSQELFDMFGTSEPTIEQIENYICDAIISLNMDFIVCDITVDENIDNVMDGSLRLVFDNI